MKKNVLLWGLILVLSITTKAQEGFKIIGQLGGSLNDSLTLVGSGAQGLVKLGKVEMKNGSFEFQGHVDGLTLAYILTEQQQPIATLMLENRIFTLQSGEAGIEIYGGEQQQIWNEFEEVMRDIKRKQMQMEQKAKAAYAAQNQMQMQALQSEFEKYAVEVQKKQEALLKTYKDTPAAACFVATAMEQMDYKTLQATYDMFGESARASFFGQVINQRLAQLRNLEVGGTAPDFKAATLNGDTVSLYGTEARVKLVDFWASWCGPCRHENPNVRKIYEKYHKAGLEIISVSLDTKKQDWARAIREDKLTWINVSDLTQNSPLALRYVVKAIPCTFLLDGNNRIVAKNLRGKDLQKKIAEMLEEK